MLKRRSPESKTRAVQLEGSSEAKAGWQRPLAALPSRAITACRDKMVLTLQKVC